MTTRELRSRHASPSRETAALMRMHLMFFLPFVFEVLHPGEDALKMQWYLRAMCQAFHKVAMGQSLRLVINVPPRHLKSITSVAFTAWMLGRDPRLKIMLVTYGESLSRDHLTNLHKIMSHPYFGQLFPKARLTSKAVGKNLLVTTQGGGCRGVTVKGATTGHGADIIIIDDAMKADDITSQAKCEELDRFYTGTLITRLNNKLKGAIISVQQRLGQRDLPQRLLDAGADHLSLPSYQDEGQLIDIGLGRLYSRKPGEILRPEREPMSVLEQYRRDMGPHAFATQFLQLPGALEGNVIRTDAIGRFDLADYPRKRFGKIVQSWDVATTIGPNSDFSVCLTVGYIDGRWHLIHALRVQREFPQLVDLVRGHHRLWKPDALLVEDAAFGQQLGQELRHRHGMRPIMLRPNADKFTRMVGQLAMIEEGDFLIPHEAPWLSALLDELRFFPAGSHDDQVDALAQFLDWSKRRDKWARAAYDPCTGRKLYVQRPDPPRRR